MDYDIIATLGPTSSREADWRNLMEAGATAFRLNTSHMSLEQLFGWIERLESFRARLNPQPPLILDLQGSKWRLGDFPVTQMAPGQRVELILATEEHVGRFLPVPHADFFRAAQVSSKELSLNDAKLQMVVESAGDDRMTATITRGGSISSRKGITYLSSSYRHEALPPKDRQIVDRTQQIDSVRYALSYVKDAEEMGKYRSSLGPSICLIAKIERQPALDQAESIARHADELWLCRGDLGAELGMRVMAETTESFSERVRFLQRPVMLAGQVLEHMTGNDTPTRSEICYIFESLRKGYAGVVLSDETAVGLHPVQACQAAALFRN